MFMISMKKITKFYYLKIKENKLIYFLFGA